MSTPHKMSVQNMSKKQRSTHLHELITIKSKLRGYLDNHTTNRVKLYKIAREMMINRKIGWNPYGLYLLVLDVDDERRFRFGN